MGPVPDAKLLLLARDLRARAKEILIQAETMRDAEARRKMRGIAASYEQLAQRLEKESGGAETA
jgi:AmiR/NasT family two-component response regulator